ncbi:MAG: phage tail tape measure protein, partial [Candidatus Omnitrophica bacterium]|nr:phage tail tape measure protein [Candidatus Omnitrophota bacterium]
MADYKIGVDLVLKDMASGNLKSFKKMVSDIKPDFGALAMATGAATVAMGLFGKSAIESASKFETSMAEIATLVDITQVNIQGMSADIMDLAEIVPQTANQLAKGMYQIISASIPASEAMGVLEVSAKAATAGLSDTFTAVDSITTVLNAYGLQAEDAGKISDLMFQAIKLGKTTFPELASAIGTVATPAAKAGVAIEEIMAAISTMTRKGLDSATATTYLRQVIMSILSPSSEATKLAKELGFEFSATALKTKGLSNFLADMDKVVGNNSEALTTLFGNVRAFTGVLTIAGDGAEDFNKDITAMYSSAGSTADAYDKIMGTHDATMKILSSTWENFMIQLGTIFIPLATTVAKKVSDIIGQIKDWTEGNEGLIKIIGIAGGGGLTLIAGMAGLGF